MISKSLQEIQTWVSGEGLPSGNEDILIAGISINSRTIAAGNLFVPIKGENFNGHLFVKDAVGKGAIASLWEKGEPNPPKDILLIYVEDTLLALQDLARNYRNSLGLKVIGVTGSNGKTTTKDMITSILSTTYKVHKTEGNYNNHIGLPLTILQMEETVEVAVLEMGMSSKGEIELLSTIARPDIAIITNIGESHLQDLGSREGIASAKLEIVAGMNNGTLYYFGDEPLLTTKVKTFNTRVKAVPYGVGTENSFYPLHVNIEEQGATFAINQEPTREFFIPILGEHNVLNAIGAIAIARELGVNWESIEKGLLDLKVTNMRMETIRTRNGLTIINDAYNASPTSMKAAITSLVKMRGYQRKIVVLGDMLELGDNEVEFHKEIGEILDPAEIDYVFTFGKLGNLIAEQTRGKYASDKVCSYLDKQELIKDITAMIQANDILLLKASRGMKLEEIAEELQK